MFEQAAVTLHDLNVYSVIFRLLLAVIFGGIIGMEREIKRRPAGFRTYMLVCVGSTIVMLTNQYIALAFQSDPARLGAQVISGIGFLGAGTIIVTRHHQVVGLTTAAGLWACACMGLAIGIGFYTLAIVGSIAIVLIFTLLYKFDTLMLTNSKMLEIYVELNEGFKLKEFFECLAQQSIAVKHVDVVKSKYSESTAAMVLLSLPKRRAHFEVIEELLKLKAVDFIEEI